MSGIVSDNIEWGASGLVKTPTTGAPSTGSSNPVVTTNPDAVGDRFINTTSGELFVATDVTTDENIWKGQLGTTVQPPAYYGSRGVWVGGVNAVSNVMDYVTLSSLGDASDFGDLTVAARQIACCSNGTRGICAGRET